MQHHCPKCERGTNLEATHCPECGASFVAIETDVEDSSETALVSKGTVVWLFILLFFSPLLVGGLFWTLNGNGKAFVYSIGCLPFYIAWFPSGLIAAICGAGWSQQDSGRIWAYSAMGYVIYGFCFCAMLSFRRRWHTTCAAVFLLTLVALNATGCQKVADASMRGWSP